jgi:hypothetical protein
MSGNWIEEEERVIKFSEDNPATFSLYVNLIYTNLIPTGASNQPITSTEKGAEYAVLTKLYVLCEMLQDTRAKNAAVSAILAAAKEKTVDGTYYLPTQDDINTMYAGATKVSMGRQLFADICSTIDRRWVSKSSETLPKDFLVDLVVALGADRDKSLDNKARSSGPGRYLEKED